MDTINITELCDIQVGKTPSRSNSSYWGEGAPWLSISDMNQGDYLDRTKETITAKAIKECNCKLIPEHTVLLSFKLSIGKVGITKIPMYTNEAIAAFIIKDRSRLHPRFLYYALKSADHTIESNKAVMGRTLNKELLKKIVIPLPSPEEQELIIKKLDLAQDLQKKRNRSLNYLDEYLESVFIEMFGDPVKNPKNWETKTIEEIVTSNKHSIKRGPFGGALKKEIFVSEGYLVYEQFHALNNDFSMARYFINEEKFNELKAFEVKPGDIIISCSGVYLGKLAIVPEGSKQGIINQALLKISLDNTKMNNTLFLFIFRNNNFKSRFIESQIGSGIPNFPPISEFKKFKFICPPIELQNNFADIVKKIASLKQKLITQQSDLNAHYSSLLYQVFA